MPSRFGRVPPRLVVIVGPTASGKTALALGLADAVRARIY